MPRLAFLRRAVPLLLVSGLLSPLLHAHPDTLTLLWGHDDRRPVPAEQYPWRAIGHLVFASGGRCSGAQVSPRHVVTAAHCLLDRHGRIDPPRTFEVARGTIHRDVGRYQLARGFREGVVRRPDGMIIPATIATRDYAFVELQQPLGQPGEQFALPSLSPWPSQATPGRRHAPLPTVTHAGFSEDGQGRLLAHIDCSVVRAAWRGMVEHRCDTLQGDSGSPLFMHRDGRVWLLAIQSSAPADLADRHRADNMAVSSGVFAAELRRFMAGPGRKASRQAGPRAAGR